MKGVEVVLFVLLVSMLCYYCYGETEQQQQYLATVHHAPEGYLRSNKRCV